MDCCGCKVLRWLQICSRPYQQNRLREPIDVTDVTNVWPQRHHATKTRMLHLLQIDFYRYLIQAILIFSLSEWSSMELLVALEEAVQLVLIPVGFAIFQDMKTSWLNSKKRPSKNGFVQCSMANITKDTNTPANWCPFSWVFRWQWLPPMEHCHGLRVLLEPGHCHRQPACDFTSKDIRCRQRDKCWWSQLDKGVVTVLILSRSQWPTVNEKKKSLLPAAGYPFGIWWQCWHLRGRTAPLLGLLYQQVADTLH